MRPRAARQPWCGARTRHSREHHASPHAGQHGKLCPARAHATHTPGTRRRDVFSSATSELNGDAGARGVAGPSDDSDDAAMVEAVLLSQDLAKRLVKVRVDGTFLRPSFS